jgi:putative transposase
VRYIQLNPLRAKLVAGIRKLSNYPYGGLGVIMGKVSAEWQDAKYILGLFGKKHP